MSEGARITRTVVTELDVEQLWSLVADGDGWASWMVDEAHVDVTPGSAGTVVDDGVARTVRIDELDEHRLTFTWWPEARPELVSAVELVVLPAVGGSQLQVTEIALSASAVPPLAWDVRLMLLVAQALAVYV
jgi:uncharacterized protein YndB with AHSA1/START domain